MKQIQFIGISPEEHNSQIFDFFNKKIEELKKALPSSNQEEYLTRKQVSEMLQVDYSTLHNWKKSRRR